MVVEDAGQTRNVFFEKMVYGGEGLARTEDGVLLVPLVLPGESATVELEERYKGVRRGRLLQLVQPSSDRIAPECPYFARCGGCHYQHVGYERQLEIKQQILGECFERIGKYRLEVPINVLSAGPWHYRNRTRFQIEKDASRFEIGYFELLSHRLCPIEVCPVISPAINEVLRKFSPVVAALFPDGKAEVELFASDSDQEMLATVYSDQTAAPDFGNALRNAIPSIQSVCWVRDSPATKPEEGTIWGSGAIAYHVGEFHYRVGHGSFFQANRFLLKQLISVVAGDLEGKTALDLYAGVGLFTIPLARRFDNVAAVESDRASARDLISNVGPVSARAYELTAEKFLATASRDWEVVVADPPRAGLSKIVTEHLCRLRPRRVVYVSCDPATLARDVAALARGGYGVCSVSLVDQFPQTFHVESVVHMSRL